MVRAHQSAAWSLYALIGGVFLGLALLYPPAYVQLTYEDLYGEWLQTWLFIAVFLLSIPLAQRPWRYRWFFSVLALAAFYTVMEEISWGQRLIGIESPEFFANNNVQGETNLHNLLTGPDSTLLKDVVEYTLAAALIGYGLLYPLALRSGWSLARRVDELGVAPPPLYLWMFFLNAACFEVGWFQFNEAEVAEIMVGTALLVTLLHYLLAAPAAAAVPVLHQVSDQRSIRCARFILGTFTLLMMLAYGTTTAYSGIPGRSEATDRRLANGYEKFARRLAGEGRWQQAALLYRKGFELSPENLPMLHQALEIYARAGDTPSYRRYSRVMLDATAKTVVRRDPSVANLLMLADNYAGIQAQAEASSYLEQAQTAARTQIATAPQDSSGYYWLGRVYQQAGKYPQALDAYAEAQAIEPGRSRNIMALRALEHAMARKTEAESKPR